MNYLLSYAAHTNFVENNKLKKHHSLDVNPDGTNGQVRGQK